MHGFSPGGKARFGVFCDSPPETTGNSHKTAGFARIGGMLLDGGAASS